MYRIVFFKIPFMRGGYRVPACPFGGKPITHMAAYKVAEVVTDLAFAETQREIIVDGDTAIAADDGMANYVYIAQTNNSTIGNYNNDLRPAYYWVDDLQFVGAQGNDTPAAVVTISPDVWLTDFFSSQPIVQGRLAQSTVLFGESPRTPLVAPVFDAGDIVQYEPISDYLEHGFLIGVFALNSGEIALFATEMDDTGGLRLAAKRFGGTATIEQTGLAGDTSWAASCVRLYVLPYDFARVKGTNTPLVNYDDTANVYEIKTADNETMQVYPISQGVGANFGLKRVFDVEIATAGFNDIHSKYYIMTPARIVELREINGIQLDGGGRIKVASFYVSMARAGDDGISVYMQISGEWYDVSNDFIADFAANEKAIQQAQQKQIVALQAIAGVIGAAGGVVGGVASGNYFGAVQSAAGGAQTIAELGAARRTPAQINSGGGSLSFFDCVGALVLVVGMGTPINNSEIILAEDEFGWLYDNAPFKTYMGNMPLGDYYRFSEVAVCNMTGGQGAQQEVANALASGVRFVDIS